MSSNISISCAMCGRREMNGWIALVSAPGLFSGQLCDFPWLTMQFHCLQPSASIGRPPRAKCYGSLQARQIRSEEHTSELQSLMRISYAVFCLKKKKYNIK